MKGLYSRAAQFLAARILLVDQLFRQVKPIYERNAGNQPKLLILSGGGITASVVDVKKRSQRQ